MTSILLALQVARRLNLQLTGLLRGFVKTICLWVPTVWRPEPCPSQYSMAVSFLRYKLELGLRAVYHAPQNLQRLGWAGP